jgi:hypothetical protein
VTSTSTEPRDDDHGVPATPSDAHLAELLVANRLCGDVATPARACIENCRRMIAGDVDCTFGLSDWRDATFEEAIGAVEALGGGRMRDESYRGPGYIDPSGVLAGIARHRDLLGRFVAGGGGTVLVATGHPVLLPHYGAVARALSGAGCTLLQPGPATYVNGVAVLAFDGAPQHTHRPDSMVAMLAELEASAPDLVVADHGFAGAAIEAGISTLSIADVNDPALPLAQARGRTEGVLLIDDGLRTELFAPVTAAILAWAS